MTERDQARHDLRAHAIAAKLEIEAVLTCLGWPTDMVLGRALDRLNEIKERTGPV